MEKSSVELKGCKMRIKQHCQKNKSFIEALDSTWFQGLSFVQLGAQCFMEDLEF